MIKKLLCTVFIAWAINSNAQSGVSNLSFESWSNNLAGFAPTGWVGQNATQQTVGAQHLSNYARVKTGPVGPSQDGFIVLAQFSGNTFYSGASFTLNPAALTGFYRTSSLVAGDSVLIQCIMQKAGNLIAIGQFYETTNKSAWTSFSIPLNYFGGNPDTVTIYIAASGGWDANSVGSTIDVDNFGFSFTNAIDENSIGTPFLTYPNPASKEFNIICNNPGEATVTISDTQGKIMETVPLTGEKTRIDLNDYTSGLYYYSISDRSGKVVFNSKIAITH